MTRKSVSKKDVHGKTCERNDEGRSCDDTQKTTTTTTSPTYGEYELFFSDERIGVLDGPRGRRRGSDLRRLILAGRNIGLRAHRTPSDHSDPPRSSGIPFGISVLRAAGRLARTGGGVESVLVGRRIDGRGTRSRARNDEVGEGDVGRTAGLQGDGVAAKVLQHVEDGRKAKVLHSALSFRIQSHPEMLRRRLQSQLLPQLRATFNLANVIFAFIVF